MLVHFSTSGVSMQFNVLSSSDSAQGMLGRNGYQRINMDFQFISDLVYSATRDMYDGELTKANGLYSALVDKI